MQRFLGILMLGLLLVVGGSSASWAQIEVEASPLDATADRPVVQAEEPTDRIETDVPLPWAYVPPVNPPIAENPTAFTYVKTPDPEGDDQSLELAGYRTVPGPDVGADDPDLDIPSYRSYPNPDRDRPAPDGTDYQANPSPDVGEDVDAVEYEITTR